MRTSRIVLAAVAATILSTAAFAVPPSASQVSVPAGAEMSRREAKLDALFSSPEERMMFRIQMHQQMHGMAKADRKAFRKQQMQKIKAMNDSEKASWRQGLDSQWAALSPGQRERIEAKFQRHEERHESHMDQRHGGQGAYPQQQPPQQQ
ncbi:MAG TPA: hypothetical protein VMF58_08140 [Rhizomicrobium sp.]|nr:hypothetical protein [Rhizomicrobium sp.]